MVELVELVEPVALAPVLPVIPVAPVVPEMPVVPWGASVVVVFELDGAPDEWWVSVTTIPAMTTRTATVTTVLREREP